MNKIIDEIRKELVIIGPILYEKFNEATKAMNNLAATFQKTSIK